MSEPTDGEIDQTLKARWQAIGLSPADLAEVLEAGFEPSWKNADSSGGVSTKHLNEVAASLGVPVELFNVGAQYPRGKIGGGSASGSLQSLLELRLLKAFGELRDFGSKRMLVELTEQIVRRQTVRP